MYRTILSLSELQDYLSAATIAAFDFETAPDERWRSADRAALDAHKAHIAGISFSVAEGDAVYLPFAHTVGENAADPAAIWEWLKVEFFESAAITKVAHNLAFEAAFLYARGIIVQEPCYDTIAAAQLIYKNEKEFRGLADRGLPVNSSNAGDMVAYLSSYETSNLNKIPLMKSTERLGWLSETEFFPYTASKDVCFETDLSESDEVHRSLAEHGSFEAWHSAAEILRKNPFARFMLASAFAAPLLEPLSHRVFFVNIWHDTTSGKSAVAKLAVAAWGNPLKIMGSFNATAVGLERKADTLRHILYGLDERQLQMDGNEELGLGRTRRENFQGENGMQASDVPQPDSLTIEMPIATFTE